MNAQQLRNSILQEAIEGRLVPQDPNDEPASALLERICKENLEAVDSLVGSPTRISLPRHCPQSFACHEGV